MRDSSPLWRQEIPDKIHFQAIHSESSDTFSDQSPTLDQGPLVQQSKAQTEMQFVNEEDFEALGATAPPLPMAEELKTPAASTTQSVSKTDSPTSKKDKWSRLLGADDFYLHDLTDMDPEVAPNMGQLAGQEDVKKGVERRRKHEFGNEDEEKKGKEEKKEERERMKNRKIGKR
ncbi:hypothetical protein STEG23_020150 [Scotinomys teguina]